MMLRTRKWSWYSHVLPLHITGVISHFYANNVELGACAMMSEQQQKRKINLTQSGNVCVCKVSKSQLFQGHLLGGGVCVCVWGGVLGDRGCVQLLLFGPASRWLMISTPLGSTRSRPPTTDPPPPREFIQHTHTLFTPFCCLSPFPFQTDLWIYIHLPIYCTWSFVMSCNSRILLSYAARHLKLF